MAELKDIFTKEPELETSAPDEFSVDPAHVEELLEIKSRVDTIYRGKRKVQVINCGDYPTETSELGNCRVYHHADHDVLSVHHGQIAEPEEGNDVSLVDFIIIMHEYGHISLGHMNDDQTRKDSPFQLIEELYDLIEEDGALLAQNIAENCDIELDVAERLLTRLMDDPDLLHSLLNIAMDMSVNTCILEPNDIHYIEQEITKKFKRLNLWDNRKEHMVSSLEDMATEEFQRDTKQKLHEYLEKLRKRVMLKFVLPEDYKLGVNDAGEDVLFPNGKTYYEYFRLIISHLDQFVKFLTSIKLGKPQDQLTGSDISNSLKQDQDEYEFKKGYRQANVDYQERLAGVSNKTVKDYPQESEQWINGYNKSIDDIAQALMNEDENGGGSQNQQQSSGDGFEQEDSSNQGGGSNSDQGENGEDQSQGEGEGDATEQGDETDHNTPSMTDYLKDLKDGTIGDPDNPKNIRNRGGKGRSTESTPAVFRQVNVQLDPLDEFLVKLGKSHRKTVTSVKAKRNVMYKHNRRMGSGRSNVIIPTVQMKLEKDSEPRVVFLIDISGSMDTDLIDRVLKTISISLKKISTKVRYDVITWHTDLGTHFRDLDPRNPVTSFPMGGGTCLAPGIKYFGLHYKKNCPLIIISDFEDCLQDWDRECNLLPGYKLYGINYGSRRSNIKWGNFEEFKFDNN